MAVNGDYIESLPKDKKSEEYEKHKPVIDTVFGSEKTLTLYARIVRELSNAILISILFVLFTLPQVDTMILKNIPNSNNMIVMYSVKCFFIIIIYYLARNLKISST